MYIHTYIYIIYIYIYTYIHIAWRYIVAKIIDFSPDNTLPRESYFPWKWIIAIMILIDYPQIIHDRGFMIVFLNMYYINEI